ARVDAQQVSAQDAAHAAVRDHHRVTFQTLVPSDSAQHEVAVTFTTPWPPIEWIGETGLKAFRVALRQLCPSQAFPMAEVDFLQPRVGPVARTVKADCLAYDFHRFAGAAQRAGDEAQRFDFRSDLSEHVPVAGRLSTADVVQADIRLALQASCRVPIRLAVADEIDRPHPPHILTASNL